MDASTLRLGKSAVPVGSPLSPPLPRFSASSSTASFTTTNSSPVSFAPLVIRSRISPGIRLHCSRRVLCFAGSLYADAGSEEEEEEEISRETLIWRAVKLPIYTVALIPISVGSSVAYFQTGIFSLRRYFVLLVSSCFVIAWLNLSNDVFDSETGVDKDKKESVVNIVGSRDAAFFAANLFLVAGIVGLVWGCVQGGDLRAMALLVGAIFCGYVYQCPPFRLSYKGLGEPLCFLSFGPLATTAFYLSQASNREAIQLALGPTITSASVLVGLTTALILLCSHFHQVDEDRAVGKMSPLVRMGTERGSNVVKAAVMVLYLLVLSMGILKVLPSSSLLLCMLTLPMGKVVIDFVGQNYNNKTEIFMAKYYCVRLHTLFGAALALGFIVARKFASS